MQRSPLLEILQSLKGSDKEVTLTLAGKAPPLEIHNVIDVEPLHSSHGIKVTTKQNYIWLDASHVAAAWQVRADL